MNSNNDSCDEYIKIDPNTDVTWENLDDILCEHIAKANIKRVAELRQKTDESCIEKQGTPQ